MPRRPVAAALAVVLALLVAACEPPLVGRERFAEIDGPLEDVVVFPDEFGVDVSDLPVDVAGHLDDVRLRRLVADLEALEGPRSSTDDARRAARYVAERLRGAGYAVERDQVGAPPGNVANVTADLRGTVCPGTTFVVGAHHDSVATTPGADDNASGVAGMLEIARVLAGRPLPVSVRFVGFAKEEVGLVGSAQEARRLRDARVDVTGMTSLEMIGYTEPDEQDQFLGTANDYLAVVGDPPSEYLSRVFGAAAYEHTPRFFAPAAVIDPSTLGDILRSDHASFWRAGYRALLVTDTSNFRNPNYHQPSDTVATLDLGFLRSTTRAVLAGLLALATIDADDDGRPDACRLPGPDTTRPRCRPVLGPPRDLAVRVQDEGSGLAGVAVTRAEGATADVPTPPLGTRARRVVAVRRDPPGGRARVRVVAADAEGSTARCAAVLTTLRPGRDAAQSIRLPDAARHVVTVVNGDPGLTRLTLRSGDGPVSFVTDLGPGERHTITIGSLAESRHLRLRARGPTGGAATVLVASTGVRR